jgi:hypothetical protein
MPVRLPTSARPSMVMCMQRVYVACVAQTLLSVRWQDEHLEPASRF